MTAGNPKGARLAFTERVGGVLVAPRSTMARLAAGEARASDVMWLVVARVVAGELDQFARAWSMVRQIGVGFGAQQMLATFTVVLPDVCGILVAGMVLSFFVPKTTRAFDLAAYAWIPYLATMVIGALYFTARGYPPSVRASNIVTAVGVAWAVVTWTVGMLAARRSA
ncbi:MAG: hypothetical protein JWN44_5992 [Myxococcales bacterium]|nr:hypothetical protein [Myxococcales bacterium]